MSEEAPTNSESKNLPEIYAALGHAIRYDIINYLGAFHRPIHYTELVEWLQIKPGSFYFHIKKLTLLVAQDEEKRFYLTPLGTFALEMIKSSQIAGSIDAKPLPVDISKEETYPIRFKTTFFGEFIRRLSFNRKFVGLMVITVLIQIILLDTAQLGIIPFYLDGDLHFGIIACFIEFSLSLVIVWLFLEFLIRLFTPIKGFTIDLLLGLPLAMSPLFIYPSLVILSERISFLTNFISNSSISIALMFFLQLLSAIFLIQLLQVIKRVNFEKAMIPVFITLYSFSFLSFLYTSL
ncbi:hypothetical protein [Candidatus Hodarchaeum mangrovi]